MAEGGATRVPEGGGGYRRALRWWAVALVFVVGALVGGVVVGLLSSGSSVPDAVAEAAPSSDAAGGSGGATGSAPAGATGQVMVNAACLRAINAAQDMAGVVSDLGDAITSLNAARLDEIVRQLEPLQQRLRDGVSACHVDTRLPSGAIAGGTTAAPSSTSASASPTG